MSRSQIREYVRQAQSAEVAGALDEAARLLEQAARLHLERGEPSRAATLLRHGLRLRPERRESLELLARTGEGLQISPEVPEEPLRVVEVADAELPLPAAQRTPGDEQVQVVELADAEVPVPGGVQALAMPPRGPTLAEPGVDCWCSFCCRPRAEAGPMAAGPAGAYICAKCLEVSASLLGTGGSVASVPTAEAAEPPLPNRSIQSSESTRSTRSTRSTSPAEDGFIELAVVLSKKLGWGLSELRGLSPEELRRAVRKLEELGDG